MLLSLLMGLGLALGYALGMGEWGRLAGQLADQLSYLPAVLLLAAAAVAIAGLVPRWSLLVWVGVAFVFFQVMLGETLRLPDWVNGISPFWHLPGLPVDLRCRSGRCRAGPRSDPGARGPLGLSAPRHLSGLGPLPA
jgi:ABC-2 type transport system permease protein